MFNTIFVQFKIVVGNHHLNVTSGFVRVQTIQGQLNMLTENTPNYKI